MDLRNYDPIVFQSAFEKWFTQCDKLVQDDGRNKLGYQLKFKFGRKYISIIKQRGDGGESQWGFVDLNDGNIFKAASWGKPQTNKPRGNIFDTDGGMKYIQWTGPMYLDQITRIKRNEEEEDAWEGWDDPSNYNDAIDNIAEGELNEARVTRKSLKQYPIDFLTNINMMVE